MTFGFTFNGTHSSTLGIKVKNIHRDILPPVNNRLLKVPGKSGAYFLGKDYEPREIPVEISIAKTTLAEVRSTIRSIADWLKPNVLSQLYFDDEPTMFYDVVVTGESDIEQLWITGQMTITFLCPIPYAYGSVVNAALNQGSTTLTISGNMKTIPTITASFTSTATEIKITNQANGKYVRLIDAIPNLATVVIDFEKRLVTANGSNRMAYVDLNSEFFEVDAGSNTFQLTSTGTCTGNISYKPRWL